jgi:hypothetical protein
MRDTTREGQKRRNMAADPRVSLLVVDPDDINRYLLIRGEVDIIENGALDHLDRLMASEPNSGPGRRGDIAPGPPTEPGAPQEHERRAARRR